jgi:hypothetical protein
MSRTLSILIAFIVLVVAFLTVRYFKEAYDQPFNTDYAQQANSQASFQDWKEFTSPSVKFKALFPSLPQHATEKIPDLETKELRKYDAFVSTDAQGNVFMISQMTFPKKLENGKMEEILKDEVNKILKRNKENKLKTMHYEKFHNFTALDFSMTNGDLLIAGKVLAHNNLAFVLSMMGKTDAFDRQKLDFFVNSFEVVD